jgi:hypothetical protein
MGIEPISLSDGGNYSPKTERMSAYLLASSQNAHAVSDMIIICIFA